MVAYLGMYLGTFNQLCQRCGPPFLVFILGRVVLARAVLTPTNAYQRLPTSTNVYQRASSAITDGHPPFPSGPAPVTCKRGLREGFALYQGPEPRIDRTKIERRNG